MDFDSALKAVGEFGRYQRKRFILISLSAMPMFFQMLLLVFAAATPKWLCPEGGKRNLKHCESLERCCALDGSICNGARFTTNFTSIATEWNLLCGQTYKNELTQSIFMAGTLVGAPLIGGLADKHGRKPLWVISYFVNGGLAFLSGLSPSYHIFVALRFLVGIFAGGGGLIIFVLATESIGPSYRGMKADQKLSDPIFSSDPQWGYPRSKATSVFSERRGLNRFTVNLCFVKYFHCFVVN